VPIVEEPEPDAPSVDESVLDEPDAPREPEPPADEPLAPRVLLLPLVPEAEVSAVPEAPIELVLLLPGVVLEPLLLSVPEPPAWPAPVPMAPLPVDAPAPVLAPAAPALPEPAPCAMATLPNARAAAAARVEIVYFAFMPVSFSDWFGCRAKSAPAQGNVSDEVPTRPTAKGGTRGQ
jgi:hypothetical protein